METFSLHQMLWKFCQFFVLLVFLAFFDDLVFCLFVNYAALA